MQWSDFRFYVGFLLFCIVIRFSSIKFGLNNNLLDIHFILNKLGVESSKGNDLPRKNYLCCMADLVNSELLPNNGGIALEYQFPVTINRIDFLISRYDFEGSTVNPC